MSTEKKNQVDDWSDDELSEDDLDNLAGGTGDNFGITSSDFSFASEDQQIVMNTDSSYTSHLGAESPQFSHGMVMNMTNHFP